MSERRLTSRHILSALDTYLKRVRNALIDAIVVVTMFLCTDKSFIFILSRPL